MNAAELREWRSRFEHADRVWKGKGLTGTGNHSDMIRAMEMYEGKPEAHWLEGEWGSVGSERVIANLMFDTLNTMDADLNARAPRVMMFPNSGHARREDARIIEAVTNYYVGELDMKTQVNRALRQAFMAPFGVVCHGYTPPEQQFSRRGKRIESYQHAKPNAPWVRHEAIWDVRIDPTQASMRPDEARWFCRRRLYRKDEIRNNPSMRAPANIQPTVSMDLQSMRPDELLSNQSDDFNKFVEVWFFYDRMEEKWFGWSPGAPEELVQEEADWPLPWDELPYDLLYFNEQTGDPFPVPYAWQLVPIQEERNKLRTMMSVLAKQSRRTVLVSEDNLPEEERRKITEDGGLELFETLLARGDLSNAMTQIQTGGFPQELVQYDAILLEDARGRVGVSNMDRAQRVNVESATEAQFIQSGSDTQSGRNQSAFEDFWRSIIRKFNQGLREVADEEVIIPIVGTEDAETLINIQQGEEPYLKATPDQIRQDYGIKIQVGSTLPKSDTEIQRKALAWLETASQFPNNSKLHEALRNVAESFDLDPTKVLLSPEESQRVTAAANATPETDTGDGGLSPLVAMGGGG